MKTRIPALLSFCCFITDAVDFAIDITFFGLEKVMYPSQTELFKNHCPND